jgi:3-oxoacyl-[acyl-carrier protein] reductase
MTITYNFSGKTAIVTGAGEGIGRATALLLAQSGAAVGINDLNPDRVDDLAKQIQDAGGRAVAIQGDISNKFQAANVVESTRDAFGQLHIFVNAVGTARAAPFLTLDEYDWRRIVEVNLTGAFLITQLVARVMADEGGGTIVNLASIYGTDRILPDQAAYMASKAGIIALTREAARTLAPLKVRVNALCHGDIQEDARPQTPRNPQGRIGTAEEAAHAILFLCSDGASFITGQTLHVDGGLSVL